MPRVLDFYCKSIQAEKALIIHSFCNTVHRLNSDVFACVIALHAIDAVNRVISCTVVADSHDDLILDISGMVKSNQCNTSETVNYINREIYGTIYS